jgi:WD40 repeat protein
MTSALPLKNKRELLRFGAGERLQGVLMAAPEQSLREALASMGGVLLVRSTSAVGISPDNQWLVTGGVDGTVRLWDLTAKDPAANPVVLRGHRSAVTALGSARITAGW